MVVGSSPVAVTQNSDFAPVSSKVFLDILATIECGFTLNRVRDMIKHTVNTLYFCLYLSVDWFINERMYEKFENFSLFKSSQRRFSVTKDLLKNFSLEITCVGASF